MCFSYFVLLDVNQLTRCKTFDEFKRKQTVSFTTVYPKNETKTNWVDAECDCASFFKLNMCGHVLGLALRKKFVKAPPEAKNVPLGVKRKPGRPRKAKGALVIQDSE